MKSRNFFALSLFAASSFAFTAQAAVPTDNKSTSIATASNADMASGIIVRFITEPGESQLLTQSKMIERISIGHGVDVKYFRKGALGIHVFKFDRPVDASAAEKLSAMIKASGLQIDFAEPDRVMQAALVPNDTRYNEQWHYFESTGGINVNSAWDVATGTGIKVAVLDTGYRPHADLVGNIVGGYDFISNATMANDGGGRDGDALDPGDGCGGQQSSWHGTHVAGTIAASTNNGSGVSGVAFNSKVVPLRVLGCGGGTVSDIADAIVWAAGGSVSGVPANPNPARVLNLSLGGGGACSSTYQNAINSAVTNNAVVVVAAGNLNQDAANFQPANCSGVVTVAAVNRSGGKAWYSNFGASVEIAAPGGDTTNNASNGVLSTLNSGFSTPGADAFAFYQGTSMATPHVAGVAALMLSKNPSLTPGQVLASLQQTARAFPATCTNCGSGIVNAAAALNVLPAPTVSINLADSCQGNNFVEYTQVNGATTYELWKATGSVTSTYYRVYSGGYDSPHNVPVYSTSSNGYVKAKACNVGGCSPLSSSSARVIYRGACL